jgi:hypothetical protein
MLENTDASPKMPFSADLERNAGPKSGPYATNYNKKATQYLCFDIRLT